MNNNTSGHDFSHKRILIITTVVLAVIVIAALVFVLWSGGAFDKWFGGADDDSGASEVSTAIPDMTPVTRADAPVSYYESDQNDPLADVVEQNSYIRTARIVVSHEDTIGSERITVTKQGEKYKAESDSRMMIFDGETLYVSCSAYSLSTQTDSSSYYHETGMTSVDDIRAMIADSENYSSSYQVSEDGKIISVSINDLADENDLQMEFDISLEGGIVTYERFYIDETIYRTVVTDTFELTENIADNAFDIPE